MYFQFGGVKNNIRTARIAKRNEYLMNWYFNHRCGHEPVCCIVSVCAICCARLSERTLVSLLYLLKTERKKLHDDDNFDGSINAVKRMNKRWRAHIALTK